jgi:hypothetical protein
MGVVKKITFISLLVAAVAGTVAKIIHQRQCPKKTIKTAVLSFVFRLAGGIFKFIGNKLRCNTKQRWKKPFFKMG